MTTYAPAIEVCCCGNCEAEGHPKEVIRELTAEEIAQRESDAANFAAEQAEREAAEAAKVAAREAGLAKLQALGLTPEETLALLN